MTTKERYSRALELFEEDMPTAETELHYQNPYELLVAVILSAQCTDKRVNMITPALFQAFPTAADMAKAKPEEIFQYIKSVSYPNNKTKALLGMAKRLVENYGGEVPSDIDELMTLPGVGRKTANVILAVVYQQPKMAVDTHVFRVSERMGLTHGSKTPLQTELTLSRNIPDEVIPKAHHWLILHGRYVCKARKPLCQECHLSSVCRSFKAFEKQRKAEEAKKEKAAQAKKAKKASNTKKNKKVASAEKAPATSNNKK